MGKSRSRVRQELQLRSCAPGNGQPPRLCAPPTAGLSSLQAALHLLPLLSGPPLLHRAAVCSGRRAGLGSHPAATAAGPLPPLSGPGGQEVSWGQSPWLAAIWLTVFPLPPSLPHSLGLALPAPTPNPDGGQGGHGQAAAEARVPAGGRAALRAAGTGHAQATGPCALHAAASGLAARAPTPALLTGLWAGWDFSGQAACLLCCPRLPTCAPALSPGTPHAGSQGTLCHACFSPLTPLLSTALGRTWALSPPSCCQCCPCPPTSALATPSDDTP